MAIREASLDLSFLEGNAHLRPPDLEISPAARVTDVTDARFCFCFLHRGPEPSDGAGGHLLTRRSKTLGLGHTGSTKAVPTIKSLTHSVLEVYSALWECAHRTLQT